MLIWPRTSTGHRTVAVTHGHVTQSGAHRRGALHDRCARCGPSYRACRRSRRPTTDIGDRAGPVEHHRDRVSAELRRDFDGRPERVFVLSDMDVLLYKVSVQRGGGSSVAEPRHVSGARLFCAMMHSQSAPPVARVPLTLDINRLPAQEAFLVDATLTRPSAHRWIEA